MRVASGCLTNACQHPSVSRAGNHLSTGASRKFITGYVGGAVRRSTGHGTRTTAVHPLHGFTVQHHRATSGQRSSIRRPLATVYLRAAGGTYDRY